MRLRNVLCAVTAISVVAACGQGGTPDLPPAAPSNVTATPGPGYVEVEWQDEATNESGFAVYRSVATAALRAAQADVKVGEVGPNSERFVDGDVEPGKSYDYEVVALGAGGESPRAGAAGAATVPVGIGAMVGLANNEFAPLTAVLMLPSIPEDAIAGGGTIEIAGPPGWNGGEVESAAIPSAALEGWHSRLVFTAPVPGQYTITVTTQANSYVATASLPDVPKAYPIPTDVEVSSASGSAVAASWEADSTYESFYYSLSETDLVTRVTDHGGTNETSGELTGLSLEAGAYHFVVTAFPVDLVGQPVLIDDYGYAIGFSEPFVISSTGASCVSGTPIQDPGLAAAFSDALGIEGPPSCMEVAEVDRVDASWRDISDVSGSEFAVNLLDLQMDGNQVTDLGFVQHLPELRYIYFGGNPISDLGPLRGLPIRGVSMWDTDVAPEHAADVVQGFTDLEILYMGGTGPSDMSFLDDLDLLILDYGNNGATALPDLTNNTRLHSLNMENNSLSSTADLDAIIEVFQGRSPEEWWGPGSFEVFIHYNDFDLEDPEVVNRIDDLMAMGVDVTYEPQNDTPAP